MLESDEWKVFQRQHGTPHVIESFRKIEDPTVFGQSFSYGKVFYLVLDNVPITVQEYVPEQYVKYINNDGQCINSPDVDSKELFAKAQYLSYFSYEYSMKMMIFDLQGSAYTFYDSEIATNELSDDSDDSDKKYFLHWKFIILWHRGIQQAPPM